MTLSVRKLLLLAIPLILILLTGIISFLFFTNQSPKEAHAQTSDITTGLISHWTFDNTVNDSSGTSHGTFTGGTPSYQNGKVGQALSFDGVDDYVNIGSPSTLDDLGPVTICQWINPKTGMTDGYFYSKRKMLLVIVGLGTTNLVRMRTDFATANLSRTSASNAITPDVWQHVCATWDGTTSSTGIRLYVNGVETGYSGGGSGSGARDSDASFDLYLGDQNGSGGNYQGLLDEVRVYNRVLSPADIQGVYVLGAATTSPTATPTVPAGSPGVDAAVTIRAFPEPVIQDRPTTLTWESHNASSCSASGNWSGSKSVSGSQSITPTGTSATYTITCTGGSGTPFTDSVTVDVITGTQFYIATNGNDSNSGTITQPWRTITKANAALLPGQTVWIRSGTYQEQIRPARSGTAGNPITYAAYPGESVTISTQFSSASYGVNLSDRSYIIVDGFQIRDTSATMAYLLRAHHNIFRNNTMTGNYTYAANIFRIEEGASYNKIQNNTLATVTVGPDCPEASPNQCIGFFEGIRILHGSHHNLLENNTIGKALHEALNMGSITALNYNNVIRGNTFHNEWHSNIALWPSSYDLLEDNIIHDGGRDWQEWPWQALGSQYRGAHSGVQSGGDQGAGPSQGHIIRQNIFQNNGKETFGTGMNKHYFYQNVFYGEYDISFFDRDDKWGLNSVIDNIFKNNIFNQNNTNIRFLTPVPIENNYFINNNITDEILDQPNIVSLASVESTYPTKWYDNLITPPQFTNPATGDFTLKSSSPMINAGAFITTTTSAGSGTSMTVADARYFTDGFGIVPGDIIQTASGKTARISGISGNTLTLNRSISWTSGEGISLPYSGSKPDIGAYELVSAGGNPIPTPTPTPAPFACHTLDATQPVPQGYAASYNPSTSQQELLLQAECNATNTTVTLGNGNLGSSTNWDGRMWVWSKGYQLINDTWQSTTYTCTGEQVAVTGGTWCRAEATGTLDAQATAYLGYTCQWHAASHSYKCGCTDASCTTPLWHAQQMQ